MVNFFGSSMPQEVREAKQAAAATLPKNVMKALEGHMNKTGIPMAERTDVYAAAQEAHAIATEKGVHAAAEHLMTRTEGPNVALHSVREALQQDSALNMGEVFQEVETKLKPQAPADLSTATEIPTPAVAEPVVPKVDYRKPPEGTGIEAQQLQNLADGVLPKDVLADAQDAGLTPPVPKHELVAAQLDDLSATFEQNPDQLAPVRKSVAPEVEAAHATVIPDDQNLWQKIGNKAKQMAEGAKEMAGKAKNEVANNKGAYAQIGGGLVVAGAAHAAGKRVESEIEAVESRGEDVGLGLRSQQVACKVGEVVGLLTAANATMHRVTNGTMDLQKGAACVMNAVKKRGGGGPTV